MCLIKINEQYLEAAELQCHALNLECTVLIPLHKNKQVMVVVLVLLVLRLWLCPITCVLIGNIVLRQYKLDLLFSPNIAMFMYLYPLPIQIVHSIKWPIHPYTISGVGKTITLAAFIIGGEQNFACNCVINECNFLLSRWIAHSYCTWKEVHFSHLNVRFYLERWMPLHPVRDDHDAAEFLKNRRR